jgi:hypothetical protein
MFAPVRLMRRRIFANIPVYLVDPIERSREQRSVPLAYHPSWIAKAKSFVRYILSCAMVWLNPRSATFPRAATGTSPKFRLAVCVRVKNEGRFMPEFLAHHQLLGVQHFYLYDNNSTDEPAKVLAPFLGRGLVTLIKWPTVPATPSCYRHFFETHGSDAQWVAFIDADEFIIERTDGALMEHLMRMSSRPALGINYRYFGSSGHERIPDGLLLEAFQRCDDRMDDHIKVVAQPGRVLSFYNPHNFIYKRGGLARGVRGNLIFGTYSEPAVGSALELNHYVYRSRQDYLGKLALGFADSAGYKYRVRRAERAGSEFEKHNEFECSWAAEHYGPRVRQMLQEYGYPDSYWRPQQALGA